MIYVVHSVGSSIKVIIKEEKHIRSNLHREQYL